MGGGGLAGALEMFSTTIYRKDDILKLVDRHMVVMIPYISTHAEDHRNKRMRNLAIGVSAAVVVIGLVAAFLLLPVDLLYDKITAHLPL
jgi:hypothetical protein